MAPLLVRLAGGLGLPANPPDQFLAVDLARRQSGDASTVLALATPTKGDVHALTHHFGERHLVLVRRKLELVEGGLGEGHGRLFRTGA
jgi:hypothetical protein